jgi:DNA recombination protein RmuC
MVLEHTGQALAEGFGPLSAEITSPIYVIIIAVAASAIVAAVLIIITKRSGATGVISGDTEARIRQLETDLTFLRDTKADLDRRLAAEEQKASRIPILEAALAEKTTAADGFRDAKAAVERELAKAGETVRQNNAGLVELKQRLEAAHKSQIELQERLEATNQALGEEHARYLQLQETLTQKMEQADEKIGLLKEVQEQMNQQFRLTAGEIMKNHGETFTKQNKEQLDGLLSPLKDNLVQFRQNLEAAQKETTKERTTLTETIGQLMKTSSAMTDETRNLTRALKGKAQTQGAWGEMILTTILERSGLRKGEEYATQESHSADDGSRLRPDVIVNLPNAERIIVDAKVSLTAFEAYVNAADDATRVCSLDKHVTSLRTHMKTLSGKEYQNLAGNNGVNFVIMFIPIEGALAVALQEDPALTADAAAAHVAIATPTTLMMALRTVASLWQVERRNLNAEAIADRAGKLYDKFVGFVIDMQGLGNRLKQASDTYDNAMGKLHSGSGNLVGQAQRLKIMGAKTAKALPPALLGEEESMALPGQEFIEA